MNIRREIVSAVKSKLSEIDKFELIDLQRGQFQDSKKGFGTLWTATLISIARIPWQPMTNQGQEGQALISVTLYLKDGFANQHLGTTDENSGFYELDLIDEVIQKLESLHGENFKSLQLVDEGSFTEPQSGIMTYELVFKCYCYRQLIKKYAYK